MNRVTGVSSLFALALVSLASLLASPGFAETTQCKVIKSIPNVISKPGVYCLKRNFTTKITSGHAIEIRANNVTLDLNGFRLSGRNGKATTADGIYALQRREITVKNGTINGFRNAVYFRDYTPHTTSGNHLIENLRVQNSTVAGIQVFGEGSVVRNSQAIQIGRSGTCGAYGINIAGPSTRVVGNDVSEARSGTCAAAGIHMTYADGGIVRDNRINGVSSGNAAGSYGVLVENGQGMIVRGNDISDPGEYGLRFSGAPGGIYIDNLVTGASVQGYSGTATDAGGRNYNP